MLTVKEKYDRIKLLKKTGGSILKTKSIFKLFLLSIAVFILMTSLSACEFNTTNTDFDFSIVWDNPVGDVIGDIIVIFLIIIIAILLLPLILIILIIALIFSFVFAILEFIFSIIMIVIAFFAMIFNWNII